MTPSSVAAQAIEYSQESQMLLLPISKVETSRCEVLIAIKAVHLVALDGRAGSHIAETGLRRAQRVDQVEGGGTVQRAQQVSHEEGTIRRCCWNCYSVPPCNILEGEHNANIALSMAVVPL